MRKLRKVGPHGGPSGFLTYGLVWFWYLLTQGAEPTMLQRPWYRTQRTPSFVDALAELRTHL